MLIKIKNFVFKILYILIIIYLLIFIPTFWGNRPLVVISGSMNPTLKVGSILYYQEKEIDSLNVNDILVYKTKNHIVSHRIIDKVENGFITKGDANPSNDSTIINNQQVLGKGTNWSIPYIGFYADFIYNNKYLLFISVAILLVDLLNDYYTIRKKKVGLLNEKSK